MVPMTGLSLLRSISALLLVPTLSSAAPTVHSADDVCFPAEDPCVVNQLYEVAGDLDFGLRKVLITGSGRLRGQPDVALSAGELEISMGSALSASVEANGAVEGKVRISVRRGCSGDSATPCFLDSQCSTLGLGVCTAGSTGGIVADGMIAVSGSRPGRIRIEAAGDIALKKRVNANATTAGVDGGSISIESYQGSVVTAEHLTASASVGEFDYESGNGGLIDVVAGRDIEIGSPVRAWGDDGGGQVGLFAARNLLLTSDIFVDAGSSRYASGGWSGVYAGTDLTVAKVTGGDLTQEISSDAGGAFSISNGYWASGRGGYQKVRAGRHIALGSSSNLHSNGGRGARGGYIDVYSYGGDVTLEGTLRATGTAPDFSGDDGAAGGVITMTSPGDLTLAATGRVDTMSPLGWGFVGMWAGGKLNLAGVVDVRASSNSPYAYSGSGGVEIDGGSKGEVTISGKVQGGAPGDRPSDGWDLKACRLRLTSTAVLDQTVATANRGLNAIRFAIGESMVAEAGSRIRTDSRAGTGTFIRYRAAEKPPLLGGTVSPSPLLDVDPSLSGCPVCGNGEIDYGESCDDGNETSGDGCRSDCQDEGCIAATPGFPAVSLCDDGIACSEDVCDPVAHVCRNVASCDDGIGCTVDSCGAEGCLHVPTDDLCDDGHECTTDLCNEGAGCVYADLTGPECEDGDFCTGPGTCEQGVCTVPPSARTTGNSIKVKFVAASRSDQLSARVDLNDHQFEGDPTLSGARLVLTNSADALVAEFSLPATKWIRTLRGSVERLRYKVERGEGDDVSVTVRRDSAKGTSRTQIRVRSADLDGAAGHSSLSLSLLLGTAPGSDPCMTARRVPCKVRSTSSTCRD
jgi:cysteine-rich repeat protein